MNTINIFREQGTIQELQPLLPNIKGIEFKIDKQEEKRGIDPIVLVAIITVGGEIIILLLKEIFKILQNMQEEEIVIFIKNSFPIKISKNITEEELQEIINNIEKENITKIVFR